MIIKNARVFREDGRFADGDVYINGELFAESGEGEVVDAAGCYAVPGLIDIHFHGYAGHDFSDASVEEMNSMAKYEAANGVTAICPATMTLPEAVVADACRRMARCGCPDGAELVGIYLEGPFISPHKLGAQNPDYLAPPDAGFARRMQEASGGLVKLLAVAPELEGALEMIAGLRGEVVCSIAHTTADYDTALKAFAAGARQVAHLYNAMPPLSHRAPGVIGAAFDTPECMVELIADNVHNHPCMVRAAFRLFGSDRVILVSDSMMGAGLSDGEYELGGQAVIISGNTARLKERGNIAGSVVNLMDCLRRAVRDMNIPLPTAVKCASVTPAKAIGVFGSRGSVSPGKIADLVLLDDSLELRRVILRGRTLRR